MPITTFGVEVPVVFNDNLLGGDCVREGFFGYVIDTGIILGVETNNVITIVLGIAEIVDKHAMVDVVVIFVNAEVVIKSANNQFIDLGLMSN